MRTSDIRTWKETWNWVKTISCDQLTSRLLQSIASCVSSGDSVGEADRLSLSLLPMAWASCPCRAIHKDRNMFLHWDFESLWIKGSAYKVVLIKENDTKQCESTSSVCENLPHFLNPWDRSAKKLLGFVKKFCWLRSCSLKISQREKFSLRTVSVLNKSHKLASTVEQSGPPNRRIATISNRFPVITKLLSE